MEENRNDLDEVLDALQALILSNLRLYDLLLVIAGSGGELAVQETRLMFKRHQEGKLYGPKLWLDGDEPQSTEG